MKPLRTLALAGAAALALAGLAAAAVSNRHVMNVRLPDGSVAEITYFGDTAPNVSLVPPPMANIDALWPNIDQIDRMAADLDRQAEAMARDLGAGPGPQGFGDLTQIDLNRLPSGASGYSQVTTVTTNGVCTRSVEYRSRGDGQAPQVIRHASGCGRAQAQSGAAATGSIAQPNGAVQVRSDVAPAAPAAPGRWN